MHCMLFWGVGEALKLDNKCELLSYTSIGGVAYMSGCVPNSSQLTGTAQLYCAAECLTDAGLLARRDSSHSTLRLPTGDICSVSNRHFSVYNRHVSVYNRHFSVYNRHFSVYNRHFSVYN
jgi:hypothetical protein